MCEALVHTHTADTCANAHTAQAFAEYKTRGPVVLKPSDTAELIEKLEDSQMQLGSMATNRCDASYFGCMQQLGASACKNAASRAGSSTDRVLTIIPISLSCCRYSAPGAGSVVSGVLTSMHTLSYFPFHPCRYSAPFREQVQSWVIKLSTVSEILEQWLMVQVRHTHFPGCMPRESRFELCRWCTAAFACPSPGTAASFCIL